MNNDLKPNKILSDHPLTEPISSTDISKDAFDQYQRLMEKTISQMSAQITELEQKLNVFTNLLEISQYINQYIKSQNLFPLINDMLVGVFGAKYSTIYIKSEDDYVPVTLTSFSSSSTEDEKKLIMAYHEDQFIINTNEPIYNAVSQEDAIYSCLGVPIKVNKNPLGFIIIQHHQKDYFTKQHATFLSSLANHIGVAVENNMLYNKIKESASKDGLTNIFNKKYFFDTLHAMPDLVNMNYAIVMIDIDDFKQVNDTYGHPYGDEVLKAISKLIKNSTRPKDIVARYGGEEIIIFFNDFIDIPLIDRRLNELRRKIQETQIKGDNFSSSITASFGCYVKNGVALPLETAIKLADKNLYLCKRSGKNKVIINEITK